MSGLTREQAVERLKRCVTCGGWHCYPDCDRCWVNNHRCAGVQAVEVQVMERLERAAVLIEQARASLEPKPKR